MEDLKKGPVRIPDAPMVPYHDRIFPTHSGRFQFLTELETSQEAADNDFPYRLLSISPMHHVGSELTLAEHELLPTIFMNDDEAKQVGLKAGQQVQVRSEHGLIEAVLQPDVKMRRDTVAIARGGWIKAGHGVNRLTVIWSAKWGAERPITKQE